jgi:hypothetical protein
MRHHRGRQASIDAGRPWEDPTRGFTVGGWAMPYVDRAFGEEIRHVFGERCDLLLRGKEDGPRRERITREGRGGASGPAVDATVRAPRARR